MSYAAGRVIHDADSHVMETREWLEPFIEDAVRGALKPLYGRERNRIDDLLDGAKARQGDAAAMQKAMENPIAGPKGWVAAGAFDPGERAQVLDQFGFSSQLVFATSSLRPALSAGTAGGLYAGARAHNLAMAAFCKADSRLVGVAYVPLDDAERALEETRIALEVGNGAVWVSAGPAGEKSPGHPDHDPIWALLERERVPFVLHIGPGTKTQPKAF